MYKAKKGNLFLLIIMLTNIIGSLVIGKAIRFSPAMYSFFKEDSRSVLVLLAITDFIFLGIPTLTYLIVKQRPIKELLRFNKLKISDAALVVSTALFFIPGLMVLSAITNIFSRNTVSDLINQMGNLPLAVMMLSIAVLPAIFEEMVLRGVVLSEYRNKAIFTAALMNGLLFSLFHLNIQQSLYTFAMGAVMALLVIYTNSIFSSMLFHFTVNGFNVILAKLAIIAAKETSKVQSTANVNINERLSLILGIVMLGIMAISFSIGGIFLIKTIRDRNRDKWMNVYPNRRTDTNRQAIESTAVVGNQRVIDISLIITIIIYIIYTIVIEGQIKLF